jgi:hypothetical protein
MMVPGQMVVESAAITEDDPALHRPPMSVLRKSDRKKRRRIDRREAWQEAAALVGGRFVEGKRKSADRVALEHGPWTIWLDTHTVSTGSVTVTYTRVRALFIGAADLKVLIRKRSIFDAILESVGFGGVSPGHREFARRFVLKGRPESRLRQLLTAGMAAAILGHPSLRLEVKQASWKERRSTGPDTRVATVQVATVVQDPRQLAGLYDVMRETLDALARIGAARPDLIEGV